MTARMCRTAFDDVARARLALGADHRRAFADAAQRLAQVAAAADERDRELPLVDVVLLVGGGEHLALVDVVDARAPPESAASTKWPMRAFAMTGIVTAS